MLREKRRLAIKLRLLGKSYSEIKARLNVPKGTLAYWLCDYPLTEKQMVNLKGRYKVRQIENYRLSVKKRNEARLLSVYNSEARLLTSLSEREFWIAGLFLYLGEGAKGYGGHIKITNTDPSIIQFVYYWYTRILKIPKEKLKVELQLYKDMDAKKMIRFWSDLLKVPLTQFRKPYIKKSSTTDIDHRGFKYGTCSLYHGNVRLKERILMASKALLDQTSNGRIV